MMIYAIRRKGTQEYLPARDGRKQRRSGFSWDEPVYLGGFYGPRFHWTLQSARNTLTAWLNGPWKSEKVYSSEYLMDVDVEVVSVDPPRPRKREEMEIAVFMIRDITKTELGNLHHDSDLEKVMTSVVAPPAK